MLGAGDIVSSFKEFSEKFRGIALRKRMPRDKCYCMAVPAQRRTLEKLRGKRRQGEFSGGIKKHVSL